MRLRLGWYAERCVGSGCGTACAPPRAPGSISIGQRGGHRAGSRNAACNVDVMKRYGGAATVRATHLTRTPARPEFLEGAERG